MNINTKFKIGDEVYVVIQADYNGILIKKDTITGINYRGSVSYNIQHRIGEFDEWDVCAVDDAEGLHKIVKNKTDVYPRTSLRNGD